MNELRMNVDFDMIFFLDFHFKNNLKRYVFFTFRFPPDFETINYSYFDTLNFFCRSVLVVRCLDFRLFFDLVIIIVIINQN